MEAIATVETEGIAVNVVVAVPSLAQVTCTLVTVESTMVTQDCGEHARCCGKLAVNSAARTTSEQLSTRRSNCKSMSFHGGARMDEASPSLSPKVSAPTIGAPCLRSQK